jgi:anti-sigma-K factor RskA
VSGGGLSCEEFKERAAAYALGALDPIERAASAKHLARPVLHRGCREALAEAELVAARLGAALAPHRPAPHVWQAISARLGANPARDDATRRRGLYHLCGWLVAAALVGLYLYNVPLDLRRRQAAGHGAQLAAPLPVAPLASGAH